MAVLELGQRWISQNESSMLSISMLLIRDSPSGNSIGLVFKLKEDLEFIEIDLL